MTSKRTHSVTQEPSRLYGLFGIRRALCYAKNWTKAFPYRLSDHKKNIIEFYYETIARVAA
jgi:hypothetical protein